MYVIESSLSTNEPIMLLNYPIGQDINDSSLPYIDGALFQRELLELDGMGFKSILIAINCPGGNVYEGYNICQAVLKSKTPVDTLNYGIAASMAAAIFMCGRKRKMLDYASFMIHNPYDPTDDTGDTQLTALKKSVLKLTASKCSLPELEVQEMMNRETWLSPSECYKKGFCTEIEVTKEVNQKRMPLVGARAMWKEANLIQSNIFNIMDTNNTSIAAKTGMSLIANFLGLNTDAADTSVLAELRSRINDGVLAKASADEVNDKLKKDLLASQASVTDLQAKLDGKIAELKAFTDAQAKVKIDAEAETKRLQDEAAKTKKDAEDLAVKTAATAMITPFVGKRIKTEEVSKWEETAILVGVDKVKAMIEALPLNATAVSAVAAATIVKDAQGNEVKPTVTTAMNMMAGVQAAAMKRNKQAVASIN